MATRRVVAKTSLTALEPVFALIREREGVREERPAAVLAEARNGGSEADPSHVAGTREDLTDLPFVTIDPEGSRDLDQALHIVAESHGWRVRYAIADVAAHVTPGGAIDADAWTRAETVYCPDMRVGLHPPELSEGYASLLPGQRTKAVVWDMSVSAQGELTSARVGRAWVRSVRQYSYEELHTAPPADAAHLVATLAAFGAARRDALARAGAVSLPKPSQEVEADGEGLRLVFRAGRPIEDDNAQVSLLTGMAAASIMLDGGVGVLRTMPPAGEASLERLRRQALAVGVSWPANEEYADVLHRVDPASPKGAAFLAAATQLFRGAAWEPFDVAHGLSVPEQTVHGALAAPYAHVTAPLRRLADRYATEVCLALVARRPIPAWVTDVLPRLGQAMTAGVKASRRVDRACLDVVEAAVLAPHVGEAFDAVGLDDETVQLHEPAVVARCRGDVAVGRLQSVTLVSARLEEGPRFETTERPA